MGYAAEEMEDQHTDTGGVTIEGTFDHGDAGLTDRDRQADRAYGSKPSNGATGLARLEAVANDTEWFKAVGELLKAATTEAEVVAIENHRTVVAAFQKAPALIRDNVADMMREARERIKPPLEDDPSRPPHDGYDWPDDPIRELLAEVETMDLITIANLASNAAWRAKVRAACEMPPDEDRLNEAIAARRIALRQGGAT